jgi:hypothetical protein
VNTPGYQQALGRKIAAEHLRRGLSQPGRRAALMMWCARQLAGIGFPDSPMGMPGCGSRHSQGEAGLSPLACPAPPISSMGVGHRSRISTS